MFVELHDKKRLYDLTAEQIKKVKEDLTFDNPAYASAKRYSQWGNVALPKYVTYYKEFPEYIEVPIGYSFQCTTILDKRVFLMSTYPPFTLTLREDQRKAVSKFIFYNAYPYQQRGLIQLPTAKGKSVLALALAHTLKAKTLIVVHKDDLVVGWKNDIELCFGGKVKSGLIKAKSRHIGKQITIATVQTLSRLSENELRALYDTFGLVVQDECHRCPANTFQVVANFNARYKLGITATPERNDGLTHIIPLTFGDFCYTYQVQEDEKDILPVEVFVEYSNVHFNPLCLREKNQTVIISYTRPKDYILQKGEHRLSDLPYKQRPRIPYGEIDNFVVTNEAFGQQVCEDIVREYEQGRSIVVFMTQKEHCRTYYDVLTECVGEGKVQLMYGDSKEKSETLLNRAETRECPITITTLAKGTEGTNVRAWEVEFLVTSINNEKNVEQAVGRIRRIKEGKIPTARVYDYRHPEVYSMSSHGATRDKRYKKLGFTVHDPRKTKNKPFKRGLI